MADTSAITSILGESIANISWELLILLIIVIIWKLVWYGLALYKSIERKQIVWFTALFVCSLVLNDLGLVAIIYLLLNKKADYKPAEKKKKKR